MKIVTYSRVSTGEQNLDSQKQELENYIARTRFELIAAFSDVMSGAKAARPGLDALTELLTHGGIDAVVVVKLDRLGRSLMNVVTLIDQWDKLGVALICTSQGIDTRTSNPCGRVTYQILAAVSEFERNLIRERTRAGLTAARAGGKILGRVSTRMPGMEDRAKIVQEWRLGGRAGGYRGLAVLLGGVSPASALRVERRVMA